MIKGILIDEGKKVKLLPLTLGGVILLIWGLSEICYSWLPRFNDPFGYIANARYLYSDNYEWTNVSGTIDGYYGYGYSIFIAILMIFFDDFVPLSKAIYILNIIFLIATFIVLNKIIQKICQPISEKISAFVALCICIFPAYTFRIYLTVPELLLVFLMALSVLVIMKIEEGEQKYSYLLLLGCILGFSVSVHGRCFGMLGIGLFVMSLMLFAKKISVKQFIAFLIPIFFMLMFYFAMSNEVKNAVYVTSEECFKEAGNTGSTILMTIKNIMSEQGIIYVFRRVLSQLFYLGSCTFLLYFIGIFYSFETMCKQIKKTSSAHYFFSRIYITLGAIAIIGLTAILFYSPKRMDQIIYGRHNEMLLPLVLIIAFEGLWKHLSNANIYPKLFSSIALLIISAKIVYEDICKFNCGLVVPRTIVGFGNLSLQIFEQPYIVFIILLVVIALIICLVMGYFVHKKTVITLGIIIYIVYAITAFNGIITSEKEDLTKNKEPYLVMKDILNFEEPYTLVVVSDKTGAASNAYLLQLMSMDKNVICLSQDSIEDIEKIEAENLLIFCELSMDLLQDKTYSNVSVILGNSKESLWVQGDTYIEYLEELGYHISNQ